MSFSPLQPLRGILAVAVGAVALLSGCSEPIDACYTVAANLVDVNAPVSFSNCSEPVAQSYDWTFGDGSSSTEVNPTHTYTAEGQYIVGLTAHAKSSVNDDVTETLIVAGQRTFATAQLTSLPATNAGNPWDAGDSPDIAVRFTRGSTVAYTSPTVTNYSMAFPMTITPPTTELVLSPTTWTVTVLDMDAGSEEIMATFSVNLGTFVPVASRDIVLDSGTGGISIHYNLR